jgi:hypothetical protein
MFWRKKQRKQPARIELAHDAWSEAEFNLFTSARGFEIAFLNVERTVTAASCSEGAEPAESMEFPDCILGTVLREHLILASVGFSHHNDAVDWSGSEFSSRDAVGFMSLNATMTCGDLVGQLCERHPSFRIPERTLDTNIPSIDFVLFGKYRRVASEIWEAGKTARAEKSIPRMKFRLDEPVSWDWEEFRKDGEWFERKFPVSDFVLWDGMTFIRDFFELYGRHFNAEQ